MARIKRWTHGVVASIDEFIVQIENHEAQVSSALVGCAPRVAYG